MTIWWPVIESVCISVLFTIDILKSELEFEVVQKCAKMK